MIYTTTRERIDDFLQQQRIAVVGVSRNPDDFSRTLFAELRRRGYDVVPVNPHARRIEGLRCYEQVQQIEPPVDAALILTPSEETAQVVRDCAEAGVPRVWLHKGEGIGAVSDEAVTFCEEHNISVVAGFCPFMFLHRTEIIHRLHGMLMRINRTYPN